jgi:hypothetical protein
LEQTAQPVDPARAIARACTAAGVPTFSPHDLRHRRISLLHLGGLPWARIGEHVVMGSKTRIPLLNMTFDKVGPPPAQSTE